MEKRQPGGTTLLAVAGRYAAFRCGHPGRIDHSLDGVALPDVQWADGSRDGRLLVATASGRLEIHDPQALAWATDLSALTPDPQPPPPAASRW